MFLVKTLSTDFKSRHNLGWNLCRANISRHMQSPSMSLPNNEKKGTHMGCTFPWRQRTLDRLFVHHRTHMHSICSHTHTNEQLRLNPVNTKRTCGFRLAFLLWDDRVMHQLAIAIVSQSHNNSDEDSRESRRGYILIHHPVLHTFNSSFSA